MVSKTRRSFRKRQGLLGFAFGPMFGVSGSPSYFYVSYTCQLDDGVSGVMFLFCLVLFVLRVACDADGASTAHRQELSTAPSSRTKGFS